MTSEYPQPVTGARPASFAPTTPNAAVPSLTTAHPQSAKNRFSAPAASLSPDDSVYLVGSFRFETLASNLTIGRTDTATSRRTKPFAHRPSSWRGGLIISGKGELPILFRLPFISLEGYHTSNTCSPGSKGVSLFPKAIRTWSLLNPPLKGKSFFRRRPLVLLLTDRRAERMEGGPVSRPIASWGERPDGSSRSTRHAFPSWPLGWSRPTPSTDGRLFTPAAALSFRRNMNFQVPWMRCSIPVQR